MVPAITLSLALTNLVVHNLMSWIPESLVDCSSRCFHNTSCSSFFYNQGHGTCNLNTVVYSAVSDTLTPLDGVLYYEWKHGCDESAGRTFQRASWLCFYGVQIAMTHSSAQASCSLLTANTQSKVDQAYIIASRYGERQWIGGHLSSGIWKWTSGKSFGDFLAWSGAHPIQGRDCMAAQIAKPNWGSDVCASARWYICETAEVERRGILFQLRRQDHVTFRTSALVSVTLDILRKQRYAYKITQTHLLMQIPLPS